MVRRPVRQQLRVAVPGVGTVLTLVRGGGGEYVTEDLVEPATHRIGQFVHLSILHRCDDGRMGFMDRAKELADTALLKAGEVSERAAELSGTAREKAPGYLDRAADLAVKATDATAGGLDRATGGRFHDKLDGASARVGETLDRPRAAQQPTTVDADPEPTPPPGPTGMAGQAGERITPAATNPEATDPDGPPRAP